MFNWLRELLDIRDSHRERIRQTIVCESCETLKTQLSISNHEKKDLLDRLLITSKSSEIIDTSELKPMLPNKHLNWHARQQILEAEDRAKAKLLKEHERISTEDLEEELEIIEKENSHA